MNKGEQWLRVELGKSYYVNLVIVYNRMDGGTNKRINGLQVFAGTSSCGTIRWQHRIHYYPVACNGVEASFVKITRTNEYINIGEVQVIGMCLHCFGKYFMSFLFCFNNMT